MTFFPTPQSIILSVLTDWTFRNSFAPRLYLFRNNSFEGSAGFWPCAPPNNFDAGVSSSHRVAFFSVQARNFATRFSRWRGLVPSRDISVFFPPVFQNISIFMEFKILQDLWNCSGKLILFLISLTLLFCFGQLVLWLVVDITVKFDCDWTVIWKCREDKSQSQLVSTSLRLVYSQL